MRQSQLFTKTRREAPSDEVSKNAILLTKAGYIHKEMAGAYSLLPLGLKVFKKIETIIREEMNAIGGQEILMTALQDPNVWQTTGRWSDDVVDNWFKLPLTENSQLGLAHSHEEPLTMIMREHIASYRDLPKAVYQIQTKFRKELRAKSGLLRGREFVMKDMYSFVRTPQELDLFHEKAAEAYKRIFDRVGIGDRTFRTFASGGSFSKFSDEFQTLTEAGEDTIYVSRSRGIGVNKEVYTDEILLELGLAKDDLVEEKAIEVGNIFKLGTRFSEPLRLTYRNEEGSELPVMMGCYGIGLGRLMGVVVEALSDEKGIVWPESIAPFGIHLVELSGGNEEVKKEAEELYQDLLAANIEVLYDDRDARAGEKFADSDLLGIPVRVIVSEKNISAGKFESVYRASGHADYLTAPELLEKYSPVPIREGGSRHHG